MNSVEAIYGLGKPWRMRQRRADRWRGQRHQGRAHFCRRPTASPPQLGVRAASPRPHPHAASPCIA
eukprot:499890-Prymnesium_polylepis.1